MLTIDELMEKVLTTYEVDDIITLLGINAEELVERFSDKFEERYEQVMEALDDD